MMDALLTPFTAGLIAAAAKGAILLLLAAGLAFALRGASAAARHLVWTIALGSLLLLPALSTSLPAWRVGVLPARRPAPAATPTQRPAGDPSAPATQSMPPVRMTLASATVGDAVMPLEIVELPSAQAVSVTLPVIDPPEIAPLPWDRLLVVVWLVIAGVVLLPVLVGLAQVWWISRSARPAEEGAWGPSARAVLGSLGLDRRVRVMESRRTVMPMVWGCARPIVIVPAVGGSWSPDRQRDVLLHELAHVRRGDWLTQLIARIACAAYWFNPLVWIAAQRARVEQEQACDDFVLLRGSRASEYATHLLEVARSFRVPASTSLAALAMARRPELTDRLFAILDHRRSRRSVSRRIAVPAWLLAGVVITPLAVLTPQRARLAEAMERGVDAAKPVIRGAASTARDAAKSAVGSVARSASGSLASLAAVTVSRPTDPQLEALRQAFGVADCDYDSKKDKNTSISRNTDDEEKTWRARIETGHCIVTIRAKGDVRLSTDLSDIERLSEGGYFILTEDDGSVTRRLEVRNDGGRLTRKWTVDGNERAYDEEARRWFASLLMTLDRRTGFAADIRVPSIYEKRGFDGVLEEISRMQSDFVRRVYYVKLADVATSPDESAVRRALQQASREIESDFELRQVLLAVTKKGWITPGVQEAYAAAVDAIGSDFERRQALTKLLETERVDEGAMRTLLQVAGRINSDFELATLLIAVADRGVATPETREMYFKAIGTVDSDFEQRRVLTALLKRPGLTPEVRRAVVESAAQLGSDFERRQLLAVVGEQALADATTRESYFRAVDAIRSDFERRSLLSSLLDDADKSKDLRVDLLQSASKIASDFELATFLVSFANRFEMDSATREQFMKAADSIQSEYEYGRVMSAVRKNAKQASGAF